MSGLDELDVVRSMRASVGAFDAATDDRIRERIILSLRERDGDEPIIILEAPQERSDDVTAAAVIDLRPATPRPPARRRTGLVVVAAAATLVLLVGGITLYRGGSRERDGDITTATQPAFVTLADLASVAGSQPDRELGAGEFLFTRVRRGQVGQRLDPGGTTRWVLAVRLVESTANDRNDGLVSLGNQEVFVLDRLDPVPEPGELASDTRQPATDARPFAFIFTYEELRRLPSDQASLRSAIVAALGSDTDPTRILTVAADLLALPLTPSGVRTAAIALLDTAGFVPVGDRADQGGRVGPAFESSSAGIRMTVVFDRATARPLGYDLVAAAERPPMAPDAVVGARLGLAVYEASDITTSEEI